MEVLNRNTETSLLLIFWHFCPLACPLDVTTYYVCSSLVITTSFVLPFPTCLFGREREREHAEVASLTWGESPSPLRDF